MPVIGKRSGINSVYLNWAAGKLNSIGNWFGYTSGRIKDIFLLGPYLYSFLREVGYIFKDVASYINNANNYISYYIGYVSDIINGYGFLDLLNWASNQFTMIRINPRGWLYLQLGKISPYAILAVSNPLSLLKNLLPNTNWYVGQLINNPVGLLYYLLSKLRFWLPTFLNNPASYILGLLKSYMYDIDTFLYNPIGFLKNKLKSIIWQFDLFISNPQMWIITLLRQVNPHIASFINNPELYLKQQIASYLGMGVNFWINPYYYIFLKLLDIVENYLDNIGDRLVGVIIRVILRYI